MLVTADKLDAATNTQEWLALGGVEKGAEIARRCVASLDALLVEHVALVTGQAFNGDK
jgi:hypothetical protein